MSEKNSAPQQELQIQRIYAKDVSLETPASPGVFNREWQPEVSVDLSVDNTKLDEHLFEVVLSITVSAKEKQSNIFLVEVQEAGIFYLDGFTAEQLDHILGSYCPGVLFPYAREVVSDLVARASFPQLNLAPINFDAFYLQQKEAAGKAPKGDEKSES